MRKLYVLPAGIVIAASLFLVACGGSSPDIQALATEAADQQPQTEMTVVAKSLKFNTKTLVVPAGQEVSITLDNQDGNALHNIAVYIDDGEKRTEVYRGELFDGVESRTSTFTAPPPGVYLFRCDAHPEMNGAFIAR